MVAFTGSTATGRRIMAAAAATVKPVFLELGGKSINLVLDDADFSSIGSLASSVCFHAGQGCAMPTRMLIPRSRYEEAVERAAEAFARVRYGDPTDASNLMGPLVSKRQQERVLGYIATGRGGGRAPRQRRRCAGPPPVGCFVEPTLFADVDNSMTIAQEEIFGPVLVMIPFDDDDDAVRIANDSPYGLSGVITSGDLERAKAVARRVRTGTLGLNGGIWYGPDAPFGGYKQSGIGRQCGIEGLEIFTETKTVGWPVDGDRRETPTDPCAVGERDVEAAWQYQRDSLVRKVSGLTEEAARAGRPSRAARRCSGRCSTPATPSGAGCASGSHGSRLRWPWTSSPGAEPGLEDESRRRAEVAGRRRDRGRVVGLEDGRAAFGGVLEQLSPERLERLRREATEHIERMAARDGLPLRLEALVATGRR